MTREPSHIIEDEAARWVARLDAGEPSDALEYQLEQWLAGDPRRRGALLQAHAAWITADRIGRAEVGPANDEAQAPWSRRSILMGGAGAIAASIIGGLLWLTTGTVYSTSLGEIRRVPLADGSVVAINSDSDLQVRFEPVQRNVRLNQGEAWFQVAKNPHRPFVVQAGRVMVEAVGTAFSVRRNAEGAEIMVTDGVVQAWAGGADGHKVRLIAGQRALVADNAAIRILPTAASSVDRALAWRSGMIQLAGDTLTQATEQFNRYNARKLVIVDPALASEQFDGVFKIDDPEGFATAVRTALQVPIDTSDPQRISLGHEQR